MGDSGDDASQNVKVAIRVRPLSAKELGNGDESIVTIEADTVQDGQEHGKIHLSDPSGTEQPVTFAFDIIWDLDAPQVSVFEAVGRPALASTLSGYNGTIFAYGQTGSGKTFCMSGVPGELRGITPRVNETLFERIAEESAATPTRKFLVMCSFFEIYNEIIFDLQNPPQDKGKLGGGLQIKEHPVLGIYVKDLQEIVAGDADKLDKLMASGTKNRAVSSTMMNATSSRSHSIFTIKVHQKDEADKSRNVFAKLNLVDLAGSERQKGTGASGQTLKEGANINKSLSALGNVINALVESANGKKVFIPYRNSKLTRVLQESLGGNSLCTMLATLSPAACNYEETLSTLRYANRAKAIKVSATKNEEASQISRLQAEINELKKRLEKDCGGGPGGGGGGGDGGLMAEEEKDEIRKKYASQLEEMQGLISGTWEEKTKLSQQQEVQLQKAIEEQKAQARAIDEECRKRLRLLQEQNDLELSVRGLMDTIASLPETKERSHPLISGELPKSWLRLINALQEKQGQLKEQRTLALVFKNAFDEDLRLWVEGKDAQEILMARTGARRATSKLTNLKRECDKLVTLDSVCSGLISEFQNAVSSAMKEWEEGLSKSLLDEIAESTGGSAPLLEGVPSLHQRTVEDLGRILRLITNQVALQLKELAGENSMEMRSTAQLMQRGAGAVVTQEPLVAALLVEAQLTPEVSASTPARPPKEERRLEQWSADDVDGTVEGTAWVLQQVFSWEELKTKKRPEDLLARPPPKFVHDVAILVRQATGFLQTMSEEWPETREGKLDILQLIADSTRVGPLVSMPLEFDPADVLKGKEVPKTLKLLQLLAVAACISKANPNAAPTHSRKSVQRNAPLDLTTCTLVRDLPGLLEALVRIVSAEAAELDKQESQGNNGHAESPARELEGSIKEIEKRIEEEARTRGVQEESRNSVQKELEDTRQVLSQRELEFRRQEQDASNAVQEKAALRAQVDDLRTGLLDRAKEMDNNKDISRMRRQLEDIAAKLAERNREKLELTKSVKHYHEQEAEAQEKKEILELEVKRMQQRVTKGLERGAAHRGNEEVLILQASKQKLERRVELLEDRWNQATQELQNCTQEELELLDQSADHRTKEQELQLQLQVMIEERDALRDGTEQLWQEKATLEEEMENVSQGYTSLSDRLIEKTDDVRELEEKFRQYQSLLAMLKKVREDQPPQTNGVPNGIQHVGAAVNGEVAAAKITADADAVSDHSSHYDDDFEEPDVDDD